MYLNLQNNSDYQRKLQLKIRNCSVLLDNFQHINKSILENAFQYFCDFVLFLPASESHHHNEPFGLAHHSFDVLERVLNKLQIEHEALKLSIDDIYLACLTALYHDAGKIIHDLNIYNYLGEKWDYKRASLKTWYDENVPSNIFVKYKYGRQHNGHEAYNYEAVQQLLSYMPADLVKRLNQKKLSKVLCLEFELKPNSDMNIVNVVKKADGESVSSYMKIDYFHQIILQRRRSLPEIIYLVINLLKHRSNQNLPDTLFQIVDNRFFIKYPGGLITVRDWMLKNAINIPYSVKNIVKILSNANFVTQNMKFKTQYFKIIFENINIRYCESLYIELNPAVLFLNNQIAPINAKIKCL